MKVDDFLDDAPQSADAFLSADDFLGPAAPRRGGMRSEAKPFVAEGDAAPDPGIDRPGRAFTADPMLRPEYVDKVRGLFAGVPDANKLPALQQYAKGTDAFARAARQILAEASIENEQVRNTLADRAPLVDTVQRLDNGKRRSGDGPQARVAFPEQNLIRQIYDGETVDQQMARDRAARTTTAMEGGLQGITDRAANARKEVFPDFKRDVAADESGMYEDSLGAGASDKLIAVAKLLPQTSQLVMGMANLLTGGALDTPIEGVEKLNAYLDTFKSQEARQVAKTQAAIANDPNKTFFDSVVYLASQPSELADAVIENLGALFVGGFGGRAAVGGADALGARLAVGRGGSEAARLAQSKGFLGGTPVDVAAAKAEVNALRRSLATGGAGGSDALMGAGAVFSDADMRDRPLEERLLAGGGTALGYGALAKATGAGAAGALARSSVSRGEAAGESYGVGLLKGVFKEGGEELGQKVVEDASKSVATGSEFDLNKTLKEGAVDLLVGGVTGAGVHVGTTPIGRRPTTAQSRIDPTLGDFTAPPQPPSAATAAGATPVRGAEGSRVDPTTGITKVDGADDYTEYQSEVADLEQSLGLDPAAAAVRGDRPADPAGGPVADGVVAGTEPGAGEPAAADVAVRGAVEDAALSYRRNNDGTLTVTGDPDTVAALVPSLRPIPTTGGLLVGKTRARETAETIDAMKPVPETFASREEASAFVQKHWPDGRAEVADTGSGWVVMPKPQAETVSELTEINASIERLHDAIQGAQKSARGDPIEVVPDADLGGTVGQQAAVLGRAIKAAFKIPVVFAQNLTANGALWEGRVVLDTEQLSKWAANPQQASGMLFGVAFHELEHDFQQSTDPAEIQTSARLAAVVKKHLNPGALTEQRAFEQGQSNREITRKYAFREIGANLAGGFALQSSFWKDVYDIDGGSTARRLFYRFMQAATKFISVAKGSRLDPGRYVSDVAAVKAAYVQAMAERMGRRMPGTQAAVAAAPATASKPAPLYASRPVTNAQAIIDWAVSQGFKSTLPASDLHVTVAYSRDAMDGSAVPAGAKSLTVAAGKRTVEPLGDEGAVVLKFASDDMQARWKQYRDAGASWDYESYTPHITITYDGKGVDLSKVKPYAGPIELGPEKQEALNENKSDDYKATEQPTLNRADQPPVTIEFDEATGQPVFSTDEITLAFPEVIARDEGSTRVNYTVMPTGGPFTHLGTLTINVREDGAAVGLNLLEIADKGRGLGSKVVDLVKSISPDGLKVSTILPKSRGFWEKMGVRIDDAPEGVSHYEGFLDTAAGKAEDRAGDRGRQRAGKAADAQRDAGAAPADRGDVGQAGPRDGARREGPDGRTEDDAARQGEDGLALSQEDDPAQFKFKANRDGTLTVTGDLAAIRELLPDDIKGRAVGARQIIFTNSAAPRARAALEGRNLAYSRGGVVVKQLPMKDGKYVGAPERFNTPGKIPHLRKWLKQLTLEGERGRFWYENSGRAILRFVGGDKTEARKLAALMAIYSPQAKVDTNSTFALRAWSQYKAGRPISVKTRVMDAKAQSALDNVDEYWSGEKTGNFVTNLLRVIDPHLKQGATIDMWMMRAAQYDNDAPTATQYSFMENETNRIAQEMGWEPQQVQAAIWVAMKARMENAGVKKAVEAKSQKKGWIHYDEKGVRVIDDKQAHRDNWLAHAFAHTPTEADTTAAKFDFEDGVRRHIGQVSWEARPGRSTGVLPGVNDAEWDDQVDFQQAVQQALLGPNGEDLLAQQLGLLADDDLLAPGVWQSEVAAGMQKPVAMAPTGGKDEAGDARKGSDKAKVDATQAELLNTYAAALGLLLRQEGVGWHRPFYKGRKSDENGVELRVGRPLAPDEAQSLWKAIDAEMTAAGVENWENGAGMISSPQGMRVVNFGSLEDNGAFRKLVEKAAAADGVPDADPIYFSSDGNLVTNDWTENRDGQGFAGQISSAGRSDLLGWLRTVLAPRVQGVFEDFSARKGWGNPGSLEDTFKALDAASEVVPLSRSDATRYDGITVEQPVFIEDTGQTATLRLDAGQAIADLDDRAQTFRRLLTCLG